MSYKLRVFQRIYPGKLKTQDSKPVTSGWSPFLLLALVLGTLARLLLLDAKSFWHDEAVSLLFADRPSLEATVYASTKIYFGSPLYFLVLRGWLMLGRGEFVVRLLSVLGGVATLWLALALIITVVQRRMRPPAALLVAFAPFFVEYAQETRVYSWFSALQLMMLLAFLQGLRLPQGRWWIGYGAGLLVAVVSHMGIWLWWAAHAVIVLFHRQRALLWRKFAVVSAVAFVPTLCLLWIARQGFAARHAAAFQVPPVWEYVQVGCAVLTAGHHVNLALMPWLPLGLVVLVSLGLKWSWRRVEERTMLVVLCAQFLVPAALVYAGIAAGLSVQVRYLSAAPAVLALIVVLALARAPLVLRQAVLAGLLAIQADGYFRYHHEPPGLEPTFGMLSKKPLRQAAELIRSAWREGDRVAHLTTASSLPMRWMLPEIAQAYVIENTDFNRNAWTVIGAPQPLADILRGARRLWLVSCPWRFRDAPVVPEEFRATLERCCAPPERYEFSGVDVYLAKVKRP